MNYEEAIEVIAEYIRANGGKRDAIRAAFADIEEAVGIEAVLRQLTETDDREFDPS